MEGALGGIPLDASNMSTSPCIGGHIESPRLSDKEHLACARQTSLCNIVGLASDAYHGGPYGVQTLLERFIHNCGYASFSNTLSAKDVIVCYNEIQQIHRKVLQLWENPQSYSMGPSVERILEKGLPVFPKLRSLETHDAVEFYVKFQELSVLCLLPIMPFDTVHLEANYEGLFIPGLGTERYAECAVAMMEVLPRLIPTLYTKVQAKLLSVWVESRNGYDLFWRVLELNVPGFNPMVPLEQPCWDRDMDILKFGHQHELYF
jgi:hypothetical protein